MKRTIVGLAAAMALSGAAYAQVAHPTFPTVSPTEMYTSKLKGLNIYNQDNKAIGEIADVAVNPSNNVDAYIVSVGGFLGMGERYVAVAPSSVNVSWDASNKKWVAKMQATADELKAAPEFKYPR
jgi:sporulation protein YlmC with PRC-barrel domain